jgi:cytochrome c oxidase assembly protein Cox11
VTDDEQKVDLGDSLNERVGAHEFRVNVERVPPVVLEQLQVSYQVDEQKGDEKEARKGHYQLSPQRAGEHFNKPLHREFLKVSG